MKWIWPEQKLSLVDYLFEQSEITKTLYFSNHQIEKLHHYYTLHNCEIAAKEILKAINLNKKIYIYGDYDVDGISSTTILWRFIYYDLKYTNILPHIPNRFVDGYGLNAESIEKIISDGGKLIISVDCGVKDIELVEKYSDRIDFIITDHHSLRSPEKKLKSGFIELNDKTFSSKALAVVHPQLGGYPFHEICGAVVAWKVTQALADLTNQSQLANKYLEFAALGTIGDMMPLIDENRSIVSMGLNQMQKTKTPGFIALLDIAQIQVANLTSESIGFGIGPRLNASGRLDSALQAVKLLSTNSIEYARTLAFELDQLNKERQSLTKKYIQIAEELYLKDTTDFIPFIYGEDWPEGIIGLIAGRLTEKFHRPFIVGSMNKNTIKASARSIESINITQIFETHSTLLDKFGGHAQAAGLTIRLENLPAFTESINLEAKKLLNGIYPEKSITISALASLSELTIDNINEISKLSPFGTGNPQPLIGIRNISIPSLSFIGKENQHYKFNLNGVEFIKFNYDSTPTTGTTYNIAGYLDISTWNGREKVNFKIKVIQPVG